MSRKKVDRINSVINNHRHHFVAGNVISEVDFCNMMQIQRVNNNSTISAIDKFRMQKLSAYTALNRFLEQRGLYIKSKHYYTEFHVIERPLIDKQVQRFQLSANYKQTNSDNLSIGYKKHKANWRSLGPRQKDEVFERTKWQLYNVNL